MPKQSFSIRLCSLGLFKFLTAGLPFVALFVIAVFQVSKTEAASVCHQIYAPDIKNLPLKIEIQNVLSETQKALKKIKGTSYQSFLARVDQKDQLRQRYTLILQDRLNRIRSLPELAQLFEMIETLDPHDEVLRQAIRHLDYLSPFRAQPKNLPYSEAQNFSRFLHEKSIGADSTLIAWWPLSRAYDILLAPQKARETLQELFQVQESLFNDWSYEGKWLDRSLMTSLGLLPPAVQNSALKMVQQMQKQFGQWYSKQEFASEAEAIQKKMPRRNMQTLQRILLQAKFQANLSELQNSAPRQMVTTAFLSRLEQTLQPFQTKKTSYTMRVVLAVALQIHKVFGKNFEDEDFVEIFGSFPNLAADLKTSDIDLIFSDQLDDVFRKEIKGGFLGPGSFASTDLLLKSTSGGRLAQLLLQAESEAQSILGLKRSSGELLSPTCQSVTIHKGAAFVEERRENLMRYFASVSPVTILISQQKIILRIYDSFKTAPGAKSEVFDFYVPLTGSAAKFLIESPDRSMN
jgi:hypothetical protein